ncbi:hypothetical protein KY290_024899 [Solanum tuberosum]|uniref:RNase H type-1 domain-containing protein n=1 Tax=Solanum tuberosum TaxID=4113 RepID=A0ABQ7UTU4_SOLTU|nr:hypothetical protein KY284_023748 [Solanum tuberosum]KAH0754629.1 hypothetical protein KY290_024899 [Solanum tuberosum]
MGGIIGDATGNLIMAFSVPAQSKTNNQAKAMATLYVTRWCKQAGYNKYDLELDSMLVDNMIKDKDTKNLKLKGIIRDISHAMKGVEVNVSHCYREANQIADLFAKQTSLSESGTFYCSFHKFPKEVKGLFLLDKWQLPSIRKRYDKFSTTAQLLQQIRNWSLLTLLYRRLDVTIHNSHCTLMRSAST